MTSGSVQLSSDGILEDVEHHFAVTAGPGAGKTYWLVRHIERVACISKRLTPCARIAVISYTNVAVRQILGRLGVVADRVDASTIHSFLYRNVVRPYLHLAKDTYGSCAVAHDLVETHDVHHPAYDKVDAWVRAAGKGQIMAGVPRGAKEHLLEHLCALTVTIDASNQPAFVPCKIEPRYRSLTALLTHERLLEYKMRYWREGVLDHTDVLYFAHRLLGEHPTLLRFLSDRFPYLFIDEFQDTMPVQGAFTCGMANAGTVVGVIGDPEQAIFGFLGASPAHFRRFHLDGQRAYTIAGNRRSTKAIVELLNRVRTDDLRQHSLRLDDGLPPVVYTGCLADAIARARQQVDVGEGFLVLARKHSTVRQARLQAGGQSSDPWTPLEEADHNRKRFLLEVATAHDLARRRLFDVAVRVLVQGLSSRGKFRKPLAYEGRVDMSVRRSVALAILVSTMSEHDRLMAGTALEFYDAMFRIMPTTLEGLTLSRIRSGKFQTAANACSCKDLFHALRTPDETRAIRTVHQAKGEEAEAVFVVLNDDQIDHVLRPRPDDEEHRITYVALSRARKYLFLYCPIAERLHEFADLGMSVEACEAPAPNEPQEADYDGCCRRQDQED